MIKKPVRNDEFIWRKIDNEICLVKDDGLALHVLNKTAAHIWQLCDGTRDTSEIATSLSEHFDVTPEEANTDVTDTIDKLEKLGLVVARVEEGEVGQH